MIVGYGFNDNHINDVIANAASKGRLKIFLIDTQGFSALENHDPDISKSIGVAVRGISERTLSTTFSNDRVEHKRLMDFLT